MTVETPAGSPHADPSAETQTSPRTIRLELEFDGTDFEGWQRQASGRTVQAEVEAALARVLGAPHAVVASGRTDAGVHARGLIASFRTQHPMGVDELTRALDAVVPADIGVLSVAEAEADFHAQRDALWKWYRYRVLISRRKRPLQRRDVWRVSRAPPLAHLEAAARPLEGRHDFRSFANLGSSVGSTIRHLYTLRWSRDGELLWLDVVGDGFLYKMVRTVVGTLMEAAAGPDPEGVVRRILDARDRRAAGPVAPPAGLCLMAVALRDEPIPPRVPRNLVPRVDSGAHGPSGGRF